MRLCKTMNKHDKINIASALLLVKTTFNIKKTEIPCMNLTHG